MPERVADELRDDGDRIERVCERSTPAHPVRESPAIAERPKSERESERNTDGPGQRHPEVRRPRAVGEDDDGSDACGRCQEDVLERAEPHDADARLAPRDPRAAESDDVRRAPAV